MEFKASAYMGFCFSAYLMSTSMELETRSRKALLGDSYRWQYSRKCSLSSITLPHKQFGLLHRKLCRNQCSSKSPNLNLTRVLSFKPSMLWIPNVDCFGGLMIWTRGLNGLIQRCTILKKDSRYQKESNHQPLICRNVSSYIKCWL